MTITRSPTVIEPGEKHESSENMRARCQVAPGPQLERGPLKKRDLIRSLDFAQKRSQNAGNAISETLNSKMFRGNGPGAP